MCVRVRIHRNIYSYECLNICYLRRSRGKMCENAFDSIHRCILSEFQDTYIYIYMCVCVCVCVCMCVCVFRYIQFNFGSNRGMDFFLYL